ncbi:Acyl-CoA N-acyltransferase [Phytophthora cactorum]|nr:Acyl-CoA N-acyltransferase [Phytophthora cactorum]
MWVRPGVLNSLFSSACGHSRSTLGSLRVFTSARAALQATASPSTPVSEALGAGHGHGFGHAGHGHGLGPVGLVPPTDDNQAAYSDFMPIVPPECLRVQQALQTEGRNTTVGPSSFTAMFRDMSPYINFHRGTTMVIHLPGQLVESNLFGAVMHDIALLNTFGVKLVLVAGSRPQLNRQLSLRKLSQRFDCGMRITGPMELQCAMDAAGSVRFQIESYLGEESSTLRDVPGPSTLPQVTLSRPNPWVSEEEWTLRTQERCDDSMSTNASGEVFNCLSEQVASKCAIQLESAKLIFMHNGEELIDSRSNSVVQTLVIEQAQHRHVDGGLLQELFTRDGEGLMITKHMYEGIRMATTNDIVSVMRLIQPLLDDDVLVSRDQEQIESNVDTFTVVERDGAIIACCTLQPYESNFAEMGCVAVDPTYRNLGKGNAMLGYIMRKAAAMGVTKLFVMTTRTAHWFLERGFVEATVNDLPPSKLAKIDLKRKSKVYICDISTKKALDEKELLLQME